MGYFEYIRKVKERCAYYGLIDCPLTDAQIERLFNNACSVEQAYEVACDLHAGFDFVIPNLT